MRLATWNVNSLTARLPRVTEWIESQQPDVLCMQETKQADDKFPEKVFADLGYESAHHGDGRWNGVAIVSKVGLVDVTRGFGTSDDEHGCRIVSAECSGTRVFSVYVPNGRSLDNEFYAVKLAWLARLRATLDESCTAGSSVAVCGDFNVAPDDGDVWDPAAFVGATHVSEPERGGSARGRGLGAPRRLPALQRTRHLHVVGLPGRRLPSGPRHADRPRPRERRPCRTCDGGFPRS